MMSNDRCQRCNGSLFKDVDGLACLQCGARMYIDRPLLRLVRRERVTVGESRVA